VIGAPADLARHVVDQLQRQQNLADSKEDVARLADLLARRFFQSEALRLAYLPMLFYRNQHAYLFGRVGEQPVCIPLVNPSHAGPRVDALLVGEAEVTRVVEFSRSPFLAECPEPEAVVGFLRSLLPGKDPAQLTMNLGFRLWGQALLVSQWEEYLSSSGVQLEHAPGTPGLVMLAFCAGDFPIVFKVARDRPRPPKTITRAGVMERYAFVTRQDRVGRMADAHHFRAWSFPRKAFAPKLWEEMVREAGGCFRIQGDEVVLEDLITERRLEPLNLRLREERATDLPGLVLDYGRAIKEMAMSNIFPGDLLLKNFGVTPSGRVVFYDYDEVCALTECVFRNLPVARREEDELSAEPWFHVGPNDVFPEELRRFIVPPGAESNPFLEQHGDLFQTAFWQQWKDFHDAGGLVYLQPY
jgi:isocitrate dehydrogenase kinase/phosphatase